MELLQAQRDKPDKDALGYAASCAGALRSADSLSPLLSSTEGLGGLARPIEEAVA